LFPNFDNPWLLPEQEKRREEEGNISSRLPFKLWEEGTYGC